MADEGQKTEPATPRQRQRARRRGQVARSVELVSAFLLFTVLLLLFVLNEETGRQMVALFRDTAGQADALEVTPDFMPTITLLGITGTLRVLAPFLVGSVAIVLLISFAQVGLVVSAQPLNPELSKINPVKGFQRIFSMRGLVETVKNLLKLLVVAVVAFSIIYRAAPSLLTAISMPPDSAIGLGLSYGLRIALFCSALLLVLAILDYLYQRYEHEKSIRMSKQEVKDEYKNLEGDPQIKRRIREMGRQIAMSRMFEALKTADAVITNPTHYAVGVRYELDWPAPKVVAKGKDYVARRILRYAEEAGVPIYEQASLARALYDVELEDYVPANLFRAVARVLAHLSKFDARLRRKLRGVRPSAARA